jgi:hypothetical protein
MKGEVMRMPGIKTRGLLLAVAWVAVALAVCLALQREGGDPLFGLLIVVASMASLAAISVPREFERSRSVMEMGG